MDVTKDRNLKRETESFLIAVQNNARIVKGTGGLGNKRTSGNHPNNYNIEIGQNTKESPGDLMTLAITQTPVKDHQLMLMRKTLNDYIITDSISQKIAKNSLLMNFFQICLIGNMKSS